MLCRSCLRNEKHSPASSSFISPRVIQNEENGVLFHPRRCKETAGHRRPLKSRRVISRRMTACGIMQKDLILTARSARNRPLRASSAAFTLALLFLAFLPRARRNGIVDVGREFFTGTPPWHLVTRLGVIKNARRSSEACARTFIIVHVVLRASNETSAKSHFILASLQSR